MQITKEMLTQHIANLRAQEKQALDTVQATRGAIGLAQELLRKLDMDEPESKTQPAKTENRGEPQCP